MVMEKKRYIKTTKEKIETKLTRLLSDDSVTRSGEKILFKDREIFSVSDEKISYGTLRVAAARIDPFYEDGRYPKIKTPFLSYLMIPHTVL
jgi:hypothetical protein